MSTSLLLIVFLVGVSQGVLLASVLLLMKTRNRPATVVLALLVFVLTLMILGEVLERLMVSPGEIWLMSTGINLELAIGPLLFLFACSVTSDCFTVGTKQLKHFLPLVLGLMIWLALTSAIFFWFNRSVAGDVWRADSRFCIFKSRRALFLFVCIQQVTFAAKEIRGSLRG